MLCICSLWMCTGACLFVRTKDQPWISSGSLLSLFTRRAFFTQPRVNQFSLAGWPVNRESILLSLNLIAQNKDEHRYTWLLTWRLGTWTQVLTPPQQALHQLNRIPMLFPSFHFTFISGALRGVVNKESTVLGKALRVYPLYSWETGK